jgi:NAD(P)-dependent dehydrogenase (short-subunit alcohol dehydrogenase family)
MAARNHAALVTGGASGLRAEAARALARQGA